MIKHKDHTIKLKNLQPEMVVALIFVEQVFTKYFLDVIITAGT